PVASIDARNFVKCAPVPTVDHKGIKIQARNSTIYNASIPSREEIRRANYMRRQQQLSNEGFYCPPHVPYKEIGAPVYLDEESLGVNKKNTIQYDNEKTNSKSQLHFERPASHSYVVAKMNNLRNKKQLNTLNKTIAKSRALIRSVSLGRDLFAMMEENEIKRTKALEEEKKQRASKLEWKDPKLNRCDAMGSNKDNRSSVNQNNLSDTDWYTVSLSDLQKSMSKYSARNNLNDNHPSADRSLFRATQSTIARPYTPQHNNIAYGFNTINSSSLFRQLCALHWLLQAASSDTNLNLNHIHSSWNLEDIGGSKTFLKKNNKNKTDPSSTVGIFGNVYNKFVSRSRLQGNMGHCSSSQRSSYTTGLSTSTTTIPLSQDAGCLSHRTESSISDYNEMLSGDNSSISSPYPDPDLTVGNNLIGQDSLEDNLKRKFSSDTFTSNKIKLSNFTGRRKSTSNSKYDEISSKINSFGKHQVRPKSSYDAPPVPCKENFIQMLRQKFEEVKHDKAFSLHDTIEKIEKENFLLCKSKYKAISAKHVNYRHALDEMRRKTACEISKSDKNIVPENDWFIELQDKIPFGLKNLWYYKAILYKLSRLSSSAHGEKLSSYRFLKVLSSLEPWDICCPDISAAIEFCRTKMTDITTKEYEVWFKQQFPTIYRPETAPASLRNTTDPLQNLTGK
ncbi:coiled-coil domain-containing protein 60-like isoform X1, partial [Argonauta hians]